MPIPEAELELPEIEELDTPFKRWLALVAAALVLMGGVLALGASSASDHQQQLAAQAQELAITSSTAYGETFSKIAEVTGGDAEAHTLLQRSALARVDAALTGVPDYRTQAASWQQSARALADLDVPDDPAAQGSHAQALNAAAAQLLVEPRFDALRSDALRETAAGWGAKTDRYVLGITLLAVALSLFGLSLTVAEGVRRWLVGPAGAIAVLALVTGLVAFVQHPATTPDAAVRAVVDGDRLTMLGHYDEAVDAYARATRLRPDYALAFRALSSAEDQAGSPDLGSYVVLTVDAKARARSIADMDRALALSPVPDYLSLVNQGANLFHVRDYAGSAALTQAALDANPALPLPWFNLALDQAAQGEEQQARTTYEKAIRLAVARPDPVEQAELFAAARGALEELATQQPQRIGLVRRFEGLLVGAQAQRLSAGPAPAAPDARLTSLQLTATGMTLRADFTPSGLPARARVAWIGYFRPSADQPWQQRSALVSVNRLDLTDNGAYHQLFFDLGCPGAGEYRLDAWLDDGRDDRLLATATAQVHAVAPRYLASYDPAGRVAACRPEGWAIDDSTPGTEVLSAPGDAGERLTISNLPLPREMVGQPGDQVVATALDKMPGCSGWGTPAAESPTTVGTVSGLARRYVPRADGRAAWCWAGLGSDGLLHVVAADYLGGDQTSGQLVDDLVGRLYFSQPASVPAS
jgi:tetratricopeptide (TPR) repeat protein